MDPLHIGGEQVGYVRLQGIPRLDMMGGEFCLNATRAFATLLDDLNLLNEIKTQSESQEDPSFRVSMGHVEVSGADSPVTVRVTRKKGALPFAEACLHFTNLPAPQELPGELCLVRVPGICHLIQSSDFPLKDQLADFCAAQRKKLDLEKEEAVGHLWLSQIENCGNTSDAGADYISLKLNPVVWVLDTATLCSESACGSGTLACALTEHAKSGATHFSILQPSGTPLMVRMEKVEDGWDVWVGGPSRITACGDTDLSGIL